MKLIIQSIDKKYKTNHVLQNVSFEIKKGEVYALVGQNGSGKTTIIKCILNFIKKYKGNVYFNDKDIKSLMEANKVGYSPELVLFPSLTTLKDYLSDLGYLRGFETKKIEEKIEKITTQLELNHFLNKPIDKFSKGMKRKVSFIQAVIFEPDFVVLDEPTDGLDPISRRKILEVIREMADQGVTILITSHILADLEQVCDRVGLLHNGILLNELTMDCFLSNRDELELTVETYSHQVKKESIINVHCNKEFDLSDVNKIIIKDISRSSEKSLEDWYYSMLKEMV
jgi:ABC-2 type transport system ATP-binding protein